MRSVSAREANQQFSRLLGEAANGEEIVITRSGEPVVALVPVQRKRKPNPGFAAGTFTVPPEFDDIPEGFEDYV